MLRPLVWLMILASVAAPPLRAQALVVAGSAGASFDIDDRNPETGGGFSFLTAVGVELAQVTFGAEFGQHTVGSDRKAKQYGVFAMIPATRGRAVRPYFVLGVADYRYSPAGSRSHALGGSVGPGLLVNFASSPFRLLVEARFHTSFDEIRSVGGQDFLAVTAGLGFSF